MDSLNTFNYLNLGGYIINTIVTFAASPVLGFPDNSQLSEKYQTIITPAGLAFAIWGIIFIFQGVFAVLQMLSGYRSNALVQNGVSYWYFVACMFQSAWTIAFGYEVIWLSVVMMGGILASLVYIVIRQSAIESDPSATIKEFWIFKFPFSVHCGWIAAAFGVNFNVLIVASGYQVGDQETWAYVASGYVFVAAFFALVYLSPPDFTIPSVLVWATMGIVMELKEPKDVIVNAFSEAVITRVRDTAIEICVVLCIATAGYGAYRVYHCRNMMKSQLKSD